MNAMNVAHHSGGCKTHLENFVGLVGPRNLAPAILLYRIHQLRNGGVRRESKRYLVNSREEWSKLTGLTERQVKDAIIYLRQKGYIETEQHLFGRKLVLHLHYREQVVVDALPATQVDVQTATQVDPETSTPITPVNSPVSTPVTSVLTNACASDPNIKEDTGKMGNSAKDILKEIKTKGSEIPGTASLPHMFTKLYAAQSGKFAPTLTVVQKKLLKDFDKKCPHGSGKNVLRKCCEHWIEFTQAVKSEAGIFTTPDHPKVEFLNKYAHIAISFTPKGTGTLAQNVAVEKPKDIFGGFTMKQKADPDA